MDAFWHFAKLGQCAHVTWSTVAANCKVNKKIVEQIVSNIICLVTFFEFLDFEFQRSLVNRESQLEKLKIVAQSKKLKKFWKFIVELFTWRGHLKFDWLCWKRNSNDLSQISWTFRVKPAGLSGLSIPMISVKNNKVRVLWFRVSESCWHWDSQFENPNVPRFQSANSSSLAVRWIPLSGSTREFEWLNEYCQTVSCRWRQLITYDVPMILDDF